MEGSKQFSDAIDLSGRSMTSISAELGLSPSYIAMLIKGSRRPGLGVAVKIRDRFGIPVEAWLSEKEGAHGTPS